VKQKYHPQAVGERISFLHVEILLEQEFGAFALTVELDQPACFSITEKDGVENGLAVGGSATFKVVPATGLAADTYTATVTVRGGSVVSQSFTVSFTVDKVTPTLADLTFDLATPVYYNGLPQALVTGADAGLGAVTTKYNGDVTVPTHAGEYTVTVEIAGSANYKPVTMFPGTYTIRQKAITVSGGTVTPKPYDGNTVATVIGLAFSDIEASDEPFNNYTFGAATFNSATAGNSKDVTVADILLINAAATDYEITNLTGNSYTLVGAGVISRIASTAGDLDPDPIPSVSYDGSAKPLSVTPKNGIIGIGAITVYYNGNTTTPSDAGTYTITVDVEDDGDNYYAVTGLSLGAYTITQATLTDGAFDLDLSTVTYDGRSHPVTVTPKTGIIGQVGAITVYYNGSTTPPTDAGDYTVTVDVVAGVNYAAVTGLSLGSFTISRADARRACLHPEQRHLRRPSASRDRHRRTGHNQPRRHHSIVQRQHGRPRLSGHVHRHGGYCRGRELRRRHRLAARHVQHLRTPDARHPPPRDAPTHPRPDDRPARRLVLT
jgi:hypothetical protein